MFFQTKNKIWQIRINIGEKIWVLRFSPIFDQTRLGAHPGGHFITHARKWLKIAKNRQIFRAADFGPSGTHLARGFW